MAEHQLPNDLTCVHGFFGPDLTPALTIDSGDTVSANCWDAGWGVRAGEAQGERPPFERPGIEGLGHCLSGPIEVRGAESGDVLQVDILVIRPGTWGWSWSGPRPWLPRYNFDLTEELTTIWSIDSDAGTATSRGDLCVTIPTRPFLGVMGNAPAVEGQHRTAPPRPTGGNIDCKELVSGSTLFLPVAVPAALFSMGDGHATQGDGEVCQTGIECPMQAKVRLTVRKDLHFAFPQAQTAAGYLTFGFADTLDDAAAIALNAMLDHLQAKRGLSRPAATTLASLVIDLRITQIVNGVVGVHTVLPPHAFRTA